MFDIDEELKKLPDKPGVYLMHDKYDNIIYIGKAIVLKNRVRQYFQSSRNHSAKIVKMVEQVEYFEYIVTDSELEALVLECNLIKEYRPKYNTMLKDDKTYPYIKVTVNEEFPRVMSTRKVKHGSAKYFGPYTSSSAVNSTIDFLCKTFKIRTCNRKLPKDCGKERACLNYHIGQCMGPCEGKVSQEEYAKSIAGVLDYLNGNYTPIIRDLTDKMKAASAELRFEDAAKYRDLIGELKQVAQKQKITLDELTDRDIIACATDDNTAVVQVFFLRNGKLLGREHYHMTIEVDESRSEILSEFLKQYYGGTPFIPGIIMLQEEIEDAALIEEWLSSIKKANVKIVNPKKGEKSRMVELAYKNACIVLSKDAERFKLEEARTSGAMQEIADWIGLDHIDRAEAYDISNTSGVESVGSMIVFENGRPKKNDYRKFKIKTVQGPNDYASMREVLTRRFKRALDESEERRIGFSHLPDVLMMDGGRGQVNIALDVLKELGLDIPVCGMVKDDNHNTRGLYYNNIEIPIDKHSEGFKLITRMQDEAHRFAIEYHRSLRGKAEVKSVLDEIEGIGPAKRKALMKHFMGIEAIREADVDALMEAEGISERNARAIYAFFH